MKGTNLLLSLLSFCLLALEPGSATNSRDNKSSGPSVALTRQAIELGMEPSALGELWRNKQPVIISKPDALGQLYTTTYELSPDGQHISSTRVKEEQQQPPDNLEVSTTTTTTTPSPPAAVAAVSAAQPANPQTDWEYVPSGLGNRRTYTMSSPSPFGGNWPNFGGSFPQWPSFDVPAGATPQTSTKTEQDDQGRTVTTTTKTYKGPISSNWSPGADLGANWPSFEFPTGVTPQTSTKTELDDQGRTVTTHTKTYKSPVFTSWSSGAEPSGVPVNWPNYFPSLFKSTHVAGEVPSAAQPVPTPLPLPERPTVLSPLPPLPTLPPLSGGAVYTTTPLPSLDEFLQQTPKTIATINLDELPVNTRTRITSYSSNFHGAAPPKSADLDPQVRDMLDRGGITDQDIENAKTQGNDVIRTRVLPDGRVIRTRLRVNDWSAPAAEPLPTAPPSRVQPVDPIHLRDNTIENFLSQVQLTPADIQAQNGEVVKTLVDQHGRVLSVKFVLSSVKGDEHGQGQGQSEQPTK